MPKKIQNITLTRRENALALFQSYAAQMLSSGTPPKGLEQAFAAMIQISPSMWSQIKSSRPIGDKLARQIEKHCKMPSGWLDEMADLPTAKPADQFQGLHKMGKAWGIALPKAFVEENRLDKDATVEVKYSGKTLTVSVIS
jgi:hypothetical protein